MVIVTVADLSALSVRRMAMCNIKLALKLSYVYFQQDLERF